MKIKSIIETTKCIYAVSDDVDTIFNKMNEPYFFADTLFSKENENDLPYFGRALSDVETNEFYKNHGNKPEYAIGHMSVLFNTSQIAKVYPMDREISGVEE